MKVKMLSINKIKDAAHNLIDGKRVKARRGRKKRKAQEASRQRGESYSHRQLRASRREYRTKAF